MFTNSARSVERRLVDGHKLRDEVVAESSHHHVDAATSEPAMLTLDGCQVAADEVARRPTATVERAGHVDALGGRETADRDDVPRDDEQQKRNGRRPTDVPARAAD